MKVGLRNAIKLSVNHLSIEGKETVNFSDLGMRSFLVKGVFSPNLVSHGVQTTFPRLTQVYSPQHKVYGFPPQPAERFRCRIGHPHTHQLVSKAALPGVYSSPAVNL